MTLAFGRLAQLARASAWRAEGHRFESYIVHHEKSLKPQRFRGFLFYLLSPQKLNVRQKYDTNTEIVQLPRQQENCPDKVVLQHIYRDTVEKAAQKTYNIEKLM